MRFTRGMLVVCILGLSGCHSIKPAPSTPALPPTEQKKTRLVETAAPTPTPAHLSAYPPASLDLDGEWSFRIDPDRVGEAEGWHSPGQDSRDWTPVNVPHTWNVMPEYTDYSGIAWYRRSLNLPEDAREANIRLVFQAVYYLADVWVNGQYLGQHEGGYTPFEFDLSGVAIPGAENIVAVRVDNLRGTYRIPATLRPGWSFDWMNYGGIVRPVSVELTSRAYIARQLINASPHLTGVQQADWAEVKNVLTINNTSDQFFEGVLQAEITEETTSRSIQVEQPLSIRVEPGKSTSVEFTARVEQPRLWHFDQPELYKWSTALLSADGTELHRAGQTFGIRSIELKNAHFYLNGEQVRLAGLTRHADSPEYGLAETVTVMARDYEDLKQLNMVFSRPVHYPQHEYILDFCDRNGILLIPEIPNWQLSQVQLAEPKVLKLAQSQLTEMILADYNHPSIWAWSVGNEFDSNTPVGVKYVEKMVALAKSLDPFRPVSFASNRLNGASGLEQEATSQSDFVMMNQYYGTWVGSKKGLSEALDRIHSTWPEKPVIISEFGFEPRWNALWGPPARDLTVEDYYFISDETDPQSEAADQQRQKLIREQMDIFRSKPFIVGVVFWTYQDQRTPSSFTMGIVDQDRNRHSSWYLIREEFAPAILEAAEFSAPVEEKQSVSVSLRVRGPAETDLPSYTLRNYILEWKLLSADGRVVLAQGDQLLPELAPGAQWSGTLAWGIPQQGYQVQLSLLRPTGFAVFDHRYLPDGSRLDLEPSP